MPENHTIKKICLISNYNLYESKRHFTAKFIEALERHGIQTLCIDAMETQLDVETIKSILQFQPTLTCSFNTILPTASGQYMWDQLQIPHWSILVDPALYNIALAQSRFAIVSCVDRDDCRYLSNTLSDRVFFFPHAIEQELNGDGNEKKEFDVVFIGSCYDYENLRNRWRERYDNSINDLLDHAIDLVLNSEISVAEALVKSWNSSPVSQENVDFTAFFYYVDYYTRGRDRVELIRAIKNAPVHVFGETSKEMDVNEQGWDYYLKDCPNVTLHPSLNYTESLEILKRSKISLNSMPFFKNGTHERIFNALGTGALPITAKNHFWEKEFENEKEIVLYSPGKWNEANELVNKFLSDDAARKRIVAAGAAKVHRDHTWDKRVEDLLVTLPSKLGNIKELIPKAE